MEATIFVILKISIIALVVSLPLIVLLVNRLRHGSIMVPNSSILLTSALLPFAYVLSTLFATDKTTALLGYTFNVDSLVVMLLGFFAIMTTVLLSVRKGVSTKIQNAVKYISLLAIVVFILQILIQGIGLESLSFISFLQPVGSWLDIAVLGSMLVVFLMSSKKTTTDEKEKPQTIKIVLTVVMMLFLWMFTNMTLAFALLAVVALLHIGFTMRGGKIMEVLKGVTVIIPAIVFVLSVAFVADNVLLQAKVNSIAQGWTKISFIDVRPNWKGTLDVATGAVNTGNITKKLFGTGPGSFASQWRVYKPLDVNVTEFWGTNFSSAVGFIPTSIITGGAIVFAAWLVFLIAVLVGIIRSRGSSVGLATLFLWTFAIFAPVDVLVLLFAFTLSGLLVAEAARNRTVRVINHKLRGEGASKVATYIVIPVILVLSIGSLVTVAHRSVVNVYLAKASTAMLNGNMNDAEKLLISVGKIANISVIEQAYTRIAITELSTLLQENNVEGVEVDTEAIQASLSNVLSHAQRAIERDINNPDNYVALGNISEQLIALQVEGAAESALAAYAQAGALDPKNPSIPFAMARVYGAMEDVENTVKALEVSLSLKNNYIPALYQYGLIKLSQGDSATAIQALGAVIQIDPNHANALYYLSGALYQEGRIEEALLAMQRVATLNPDNEEVAKLVGILEEQLTQTNAVDSEPVDESGDTLENTE